jgi:hypothetical protein
MAGGRLKAFQLLDQGQKPGLSAKPGLRMQMLMADQELDELLRRDGRDLPAQAFQRQTMNPRKQPAVAPL